MKRVKPNGRRGRQGNVRDPDNLNEEGAARNRDQELNKSIVRVRLGLASGRCGGWWCPPSTCESCEATSTTCQLLGA